MTEAELKGIREFAAGLPIKRTQVADGALLDQCQVHLAALIAHIEDVNHADDYPHEDDPPPKPKRSHHKKKVTG